MLQIAVFGSGRGSNFGAIMGAIEHGSITRAAVHLVLSNNSQAGILELARRHAIPALHLSRARYPDEQTFTAAMLDLLHAHQVNFIALAGYMKRVPAPVVAAFRNRILKIRARRCISLMKNMTAALSCCSGVSPWRETTHRRRLQRKS
jgi:phosphoribosylglycinamide formyltransferase-1